MNRLEQLLKSHNRPITVREIRLTSQVIRVRIQPINRMTKNGDPGLRTKLAHLKNLCPDLAAELGVESISAVGDSEGFWLEVARPDRQFVKASEIPVPDGYEVPIKLGIDIVGNPVVLDASNPSTPNILIGGTTGSGKSQLLHCAVEGLVTSTHPDEVKVILIDTNATPREIDNPSLANEDGMAVWRGIQHVVGVIREPSKAREMLERLEAIIRQRYAGAEWSVRYVMVTDELADLVSDPIHGKDIGNLITNIAKISRKKGVTLIAATQRPSADVVKGLMKANFPVRLGLTVASYHDSRVVIDRGGCEGLLGKGDALLRIGAKVTRLQCGYVTDEDISALREVRVKKKKPYEWIYELAKKAR